MSRFFTFCTMASVSLSVLADEYKTIELGGPRKAAAIIKHVNDDYNIRVSLIPVRSFDSGMNRRLSQRKAEFYAKVALLRYLGGHKGQTATIAHAEVIDASTVENRFVLIVLVPCKSVQLTELPSDSSTSDSSTERKHTSLLTAKDDYQNSLELLAKIITDDMPMLDKELGEFYEAISDAEELGTTRLALLGKEIRADGRLLFTERDELIDSLAAVEKLYLSRLRKLVQQAEAKAEKDE